MGKEKDISLFTKHHLESDKKANGDFREQQQNEKAWK